MEDLAQIPRRSRTRVFASTTLTQQRARKAAPAALVLVALIGMWEAVCRAGFVNPIIVPPPSAVAVSLAELLQEGFFWEAAWVTMSETLIGFVIGVGLAWLVGTLLGLFEWVRLGLYPLVIGFQITPRVALAPVFLAWFGFGVTSKIVMAATICFFPVLLNVLVGMQNVDHNAKTLMRSLGAGRWVQYKKLTLPSSLPLVFAGIKTAVTLALIGAIVAEFVGASRGMGVLIKTLNFQLDIAAGFGVIIMLMLFGLILYGLVALVESKIVFWRSRS